MASAHQCLTMRRRLNLHVQFVRDTQAKPEIRRLNHEFRTWLREMLHALCTDGTVVDLYNFMATYPTNEITAKYLPAIIGHDRYDMAVMFLQRCEMPLQILHAEDHGLLPIHQAARRADPRFVDLIFSYGFTDVDVGGQTPLMFAIRNGGDATFDAIMARGPNTSIADAAGNTMLHMAVRSNSLHMVEVLARAQESMINRLNNAGESVLHIAALYGSAEMVATVVRFGCRHINLSAANLDTPLGLAFRGDDERRASIVPVLVALGAIVPNVLAPILATSRRREFARYDGIRYPLSALDARVFLRMPLDADSRVVYIAFFRESLLMRLLDALSDPELRMIACLRSCC